MEDISCENCFCSSCALWKNCNDKIYGVKYWCYRCNDMDIDHCFEPMGSCESHVAEKNNKTHPLYNEQIREKSNKYYFEDNF